VRIRWGYGVVRGRRWYGAGGTGGQRLGIRGTGLGLEGSANGRRRASTQGRRGAHRQCQGPTNLRRRSWPGIYNPENSPIRTNMHHRGYRDERRLGACSTGFHPQWCPERDGGFHRKQRKPRYWVWRMECVPAPVGAVLFGIIPNTDECRGRAAGVHINPATSCPKLSLDFGPLCGYEEAALANYET